MFTRDFVLSLFAVALGMAIIALALTIPTAMARDVVGPRAFPIIMGSIIGVGGLVLCAQHLLSLRARNGAPATPIGDEEGSAEGKGEALRAFAIMGLAIAFTLLLHPLGYLLTTPLIVAGMMITLGLRKPVTVCTTAFIFTLVTYLAFATLLSVRLPLGPFQAFV